MEDVIVGVSSETGIAGFEQFCVNCEMSLPRAAIKCWNCNSENLKPAPHCMDCGPSPIKSPEESSCLRIY
jgi:hypothetical protein